MYVASFVGIWYGAGLIVSSVDRVSRSLRLSAFSVSFILLGLLTSIPEFAIGLTAVAEKQPEIFMGNLLGGIPVIFLAIIPLLAIVGNGITLKHYFNASSLLVTLGVIAAPSVLLLDGTISSAEAVILILLYVMGVMLIGKRHGLFASHRKKILSHKAYSYGDLIKIIMGIALVFITSQVIVNRTIVFADRLAIGSLSISLVVLSLGTNLPEIFIALRAIMSGKKDVAFGDYMGSAAANTVLFGIFTLLSPATTIADLSIRVPLVFIMGGLMIFYLFTRTNNDLSRYEGMVLWVVYFFFLGIQFWIFT